MKYRDRYFQEGNRPRSPLHGWAGEHVRGRKRRGCRSGYVLVMTLGLLVLSASLLVVIGRAASRSALAARSEMVDLQHRLGVLTCRRAVLDHADTILATHESKTRTVSATLTAKLKLGDEVFDLLLSDEQAKANVNVMLESADRATAEQRLVRALSGTGLGNSIRLQPAPISLSDAFAKVATTGPSTSFSISPVNEPITSFGQIFSISTPEFLLQMRGMDRAIDHLTCWGDRRINLRRTDAKSLEIVAGKGMSPVEIAKLISVRDQFLAGKLKPPAKLNAGIGQSTADKPMDPVSMILLAAGMKSGGNVGMPSFTMESKCHSLWIITHNNLRVRYDLSVIDASDKDRTRSFLLFQ